MVLGERLLVEIGRLVRLRRHLEDPAHRPRHRRGPLAARLARHQLEVGVDEVHAGAVVHRDRRRPQRDALALAHHGVLGAPRQPAGQVRELGPEPPLRPGHDHRLQGGAQRGARESEEPHVVGRASRQRVERAVLLAHQQPRAVGPEQRALDRAVAPQRHAHAAPARLLEQPVPVRDVVAIRQPRHPGAALGSEPHGREVEPLGHPGDEHRVARRRELEGAPLANEAEVARVGGDGGARGGARGNRSRDQRREQERRARTQASHGAPPLRVEGRPDALPYAGGRPTFPRKRPRSAPLQAAGLSRRSRKGTGRKRAAIASRVRSSSSSFSLSGWSIPGWRDSLGSTRSSERPSASTACIG